MSLGCKTTSSAQLRTWIRLMILRFIIRCAVYSIKLNEKQTGEELGFARKLRHRQRHVISHPPTASLKSRQLFIPRQHQYLNHPATNHSLHLVTKGFGMDSLARGRESMLKLYDEIGSEIAAGLSFPYSPPTCLYIPSKED